MLWAEHVARNTARERDDVLTQVKQHFSDAELVELTGVSGLFALSNRFQDSHRLPIEEQHEVDRIKVSVRADPRKLRAYLERLIEHWPSAVAAAGAQPTVAGEDAPAPREPQQPPAVPLIDPRSADGAARALFDNAQAWLGGISNALRIWAHNPHAAKFIPPFALAMERAGAGGSLPAALKSIVMVRTSFLNAAPYGLAHACAYARAAGVSESRIGLAQSSGEAQADALTASECAALAWADQVAPNTAKGRDDVFAALSRHFDHAQIVELTGLCAETNMMNRIHNALRVPLESDAEIAALNREPRMDAGRIRGYLEAVLAQWPDALPDVRYEVAA